MNDRPLVFSATGKLCTFIAPLTATCLIAASGAQSGDGRVSIPALPELATFDRSPTRALLRRGGDSDRTFASFF